MRAALPDEELRMDPIPSTPPARPAAAPADVPGWTRLCALADIPPRGARVVRSARHGDIAVFRTADDALFALHDKCPHKGGPLSQGIVHGHTVTCPLHGWKIGLDGGAAVAPDIGCTRSFEVRLDGDAVWLKT